MEKELILRTLEECEGKVGEAAKKLGISRKTLWKKLKKYSSLLAY
jgi:transcriptional regulator of acetoin/glycerol metabolism